MNSRMFAENNLSLYMLPLIYTLELSIKSTHATYPFTLIEMTRLENTRQNIIENPYDKSVIINYDQHQPRHHQYIYPDITKNRKEMSFKYNFKLNF